MSDGVFMVQEQPTGRWITGCCDERCEDALGGIHTVADVKSKAAADRAATAHRKLLATIPDPCKPRVGECGTCGQSRTAIRELQELVRTLEQRLSRLGGVR